MAVETELPVWAAATSRGSGGAGAFGFEIFASIDHLSEPCDFMGMEDRFLSKVRIGGPDECWEWTAALSPYGYGKYYVSGDAVRPAHRVSYAMNIGAIPDGLCVCHKCDNRKCVNPRHLFLGTIGDNNRDTLSKGRWNASARGSAGAANCKAKLTDAEALLIAQRYNQGLPLKEIARLSGVSPAAVQRIVYGKAWRHLGIVCVPRGKGRDRTGRFASPQK